jgi:hypothetical protein
MKHIQKYLQCEAELTSVISGKPTNPPPISSEKEMTPDIWAKINRVWIKEEDSL